ncbi:retrovirus-related Pol polyprotein from transposon 297 [Trichonephila clavipes]|uniref:Retrovirus-related Pol polyprotein from transposon 297 n=1 Tax=Trichonephila clavipes TaxID=2585209 RepID=A0A8X6WGS3_TRICX|nr:retrovirus-related Pol polyprotein from transposon 297 [Trichonephila clavipes]
MSPHQFGSNFINSDEEVRPSFRDRNSVNYMPLAIPMTEDNKNLTSFKTHRQQNRFKVISFGLKNASVTFQREMNKALSCNREFSRAYIDDIAIFSENWEEHLLHLDTLLTKLSELNFTMNLKKCAFGKTQIKYLGHIIGSGKHEPDPEKTAVINILPVPKTKKELRSVLGLCNYYREYIPKLAAWPGFARAFSFPHDASNYVCVCTHAM